MISQGLYVHIPFCEARCGYCDFATTVGQDHRKDDYIKALCQEIQDQQPRPIDTVFVGGGTPTVLTSAQIRTLFQTIGSTFDTQPLKEATVEANPESATQEILRTYQDQGVNRISFGLQTTQNTLLKKLDRLHSWEDFLRVYQGARDLGFDNINVDLIFGLPGQTMDDWMATLEDVLTLDPDHISLYALKVETGTKFDRDGITVNNDLQADMYLKASAVLQEKGLHHYEISNFAKPGRECQHNLKYWKNQETLGVGVSAASFQKGQRRTNTRNLMDYLTAFESKHKLVSEELTLNADDQTKEDMMMGLRLSQGVSWEKLKEFSIPSTQTFLDQGLAHVSNGQYALTPRGWLLSNQLFHHLV